MSRKKKSKRGLADARDEVSAFADTRRNLPSEGRSLVASVENDITIPYFSGALQNSDDTLIQQGEGKGLALYSEIERDPHAFAMLQKRKKRLTGRNWTVEPGGDSSLDRDAAAFVEEVLETLPFDRICEKLLDATLKGYAVAEIVWRRDGARILPTVIQDMDQRRFVFDRDWQPRLLTWADSREGIALPARKFIVHRFGAQGNNPYGLGLGSKLFWPVLFKREGISFWLYFLEKFAGPTIVGKTPYSNIPEEQQKLVQNLMRAQTASVITVPIGTEISFLEAARGGTVSYQEFVAYWDRQISIGVCGETLTTQVDSKGGNRALGEVHQDMLDALVDSDDDLLADTLRETFLRWLVEFNMPGAAVPSVRRPRPENAQAIASTRKVQAEAAKARREALMAVVADAAMFEDDAVARDYILSSGLTEGLSDATVEALIAARVTIATKRSVPSPDASGGKRPAPGSPRGASEEDPEDDVDDEDGMAGFASANGLKKKRLSPARMSALRMRADRSHR